MIDTIKDLFRRRKLKKHASDVPTGFLPMSEIYTVNVMIDVEEPGFDALREDILAWGRSIKAKVNIYFFDFRKISKDELLLTSINTTIIKKELNWFGMPPYEKVAPLIEHESDLFVSLVNNGDFPIDFVSKCAAARFKIGRRAYEGHCFDIVLAGKHEGGVRSGGREVFAGIVEFLGKIEIYIF